MQDSGKEKLLVNHFLRKLLPPLLPNFFKEKNTEGSQVKTVIVPVQDYARFEEDMNSATNKLLQAEHVDLQSVTPVHPSLKNLRNLRN